MDTINANVQGNIWPNIISLAFPIQNKAKLLKSDSNVQILGSSLHLLMSPDIVESIKGLAIQIILTEAVLLMEMLPCTSKHVLKIKDHQVYISYTHKQNS